MKYLVLLSLILIIPIALANLDIIGEEDVGVINLEAPEEELFATTSPVSIFNETGIRDAGNITSVLVFNDGDSYNLSEITGTPGFDIRVNFTGISQFNRIITRQYYTGTMSHDVEYELFNYNTQAWDTVFEITDESEFTFHVVDIVDDGPYINTTDSNKVQFRFYHDDSGQPTHDLFIDYIALQYNPAGVTITDHGQLGGLLDNDHPQYMGGAGIGWPPTADLDMGDFGFIDMGNTTFSETRYTFTSANDVDFYAEWAGTGSVRALTWDTAAPGWQMLYSLVMPAGAEVVIGNTEFQNGGIDQTSGVLSIETQDVAGDGTIIQNEFEVNENTKAITAGLNVTVDAEELDITGDKQSFSILQMRDSFIKSSTSSGGRLDFYPDDDTTNMIFSVLKLNVFGDASDELFFQLQPSAGWGWVESFSGDGLALATGTVDPIMFAIDRDEVARIDTSGDWHFNGSLDTDETISSGGNVSIGNLTVWTTGLDVGGGLYIRDYWLDGNARMYNFTFNSLGTPATASISQGSQQIVLDTDLAGGFLFNDDLGVNLGGCFGVTSFNKLCFPTTSEIQTNSFVQTFNASGADVLADNLVANCVESENIMSWQENSAPTYGGYQTLSGGLNQNDSRGRYVPYDITITGFNIMSRETCDCTQQAPYNFTVQNGTDGNNDDISMLYMTNVRFNQSETLDYDVDAGDELRILGQRGSTAACTVATYACDDVEFQVVYKRRCS